MHRVLQRFRAIKEVQQVSNHTVGKTEALCDFLVRPLDFFLENLDCIGFVNRCKVFPLKVFDELFTAAIDGICWAN